jgi:phosphoribosylformylglycinamidine cyclo-ligase
LIAELGGVARAELEATLNMGVGMVVLVAPDSVEPALSLLAGREVVAWVLGTIDRGEGTATLHGEYRAG